MIQVNSRADLEQLRDTPAFVAAMKAVYGTIAGWTLVDGAWVGTENTAVLERLGFTKKQFADEIAAFAFPSPMPPPMPPTPATPTLTKRQINAALITGAGLMDPDPAIEVAIGAIVDPVAKALALNDWRNVKQYQRDHALFSDPDLLAAMNMTPAQVDGLWTLGATLPV